MQINVQPDEAATHVALDPEGRIAQDVPCIHCGYNLRSLLPEQTCPECGAIVNASLRRDELRFSDPRWLKRLSVGMTCILAGAVAFVASWYGGLRWLDFWLNHVLGIPWPGRNVILILLVFGLPVVGIWLATSPEPGRITSSRDRGTRIAATVLVMACLLLMLAGARPPVGTAARLATLSDLRWMQLRQALCCLLSTAGWVAFCIHIRPLSRRASALRLERFALLAAVGVALPGLVSSGIWSWRAVHIQGLLSQTPSSTATSLQVVGSVLWPLQQALVLLVAFLYLRLLRRQARLARDAVHEPGTAAAT